MFLSALLFVARVGAAASPYCGALPAAGFDQPPNIPHSGRYANRPYGYAVTIPAGLTAFTTPEGPERGFGIVLSWSPRAFLRVDAGYDAFYDITPQGVHQRDLSAMHLHDQVVSDGSQPVKLSRVAGAQFTTQMRCPGDPATYVHADVIVVRWREIYRLDLQTTPERQAMDLKTVQALVRSWQWVAVQR